MADNADLLKEDFKAGGFHPESSRRSRSISPLGGFMYSKGAVMPLRANIFTVSKPLSADQPATSAISFTSRFPVTG